MVFPWTMSYISTSESLTWVVVGMATVIIFPPTCICFKFYSNFSNYSPTVPEEEISKEAADMEMEREKYVEELRKVLVFEQVMADRYNYDISKGSGDSLIFSYEKNFKDVSVSIAVPLGSNIQKLAYVLPLKNSLMESYTVLNILMTF